MSRIAITVACALVAAACSTQPAPAPTPTQSSPSVHPVSGLRVIPLTVSSESGKRVLRVEVAASQAEQARGLMFRTELGPDEGMLFPRNPPDVASFWMKNTPLPLDIIFIGTDRKVINVAANTVPYSLDSVASQGVAGAVLELRGGRAAELGIAPGTRVDW
jgi:uncharacterized protein